MKALIVLSLILSSASFANASEQRSPAGEITYVGNAVICSSARGLNAQIYEIEKTGSTSVWAGNDIPNGDTVRFGSESSTTSSVKYTMTPTFPTDGAATNCFLFTKTK